MVSDTSNWLIRLLDMRINQEEKGTVILVLEGSIPESLAKFLWRYPTDKATAEAIKAYCDDCLSRGQPVYQKDIIRLFAEPTYPPSCRGLQSGEPGASAPGSPL
jgi:hypothetical protein